jgi:hypothetical protein
MLLCTHLAIGAPVGLVIAGLVARAVYRIYARLEERRGLEAAIRDSNPSDRAEVVRAYAECLAAQSGSRLSLRQRKPGSSDPSVPSDDRVTAADYRPGAGGSRTRRFSDSSSRKAPRSA